MTETDASGGETTSAPDLLIDVRGLHAGYGGIPVVRDLNLTVGRGEVVALLGPNGAGKTTTLLTLSGLLTPLDGEVMVLGEKVDGSKPHTIPRRGLAHVAEDRSLFFDLTVDENIKLGLTGDKGSRRAAHDRAMELLPALKPLGGRLAGLLSGGEQQMLAVARALMSRPTLLLLDEPSLGLAPIIVQDLFERFKQINTDTGTTMLVVEQNAQLALGIAHRGYVLESGHISVSGAADDLINDDAIRKAYLGV